MQNENTLPKHYLREGLNNKGFLSAMNFSAKTSNNQATVATNNYSNNYHNSTTQSPSENRRLNSWGLDQLPDTFSLTPVKDKKPYRKGWQNEAPLSRSQILNELDGYATGYGLRLGDVSGGLIALDIDGASVQQLLSAIAKDDLPPTPMWSSGKEGRYQILFQIPDEYREQLKDFGKRICKTWNGYHCQEGEQLELRYNGHQSVLPYSRHPDTGQYEWLMSPNDTPVAIAPDWVVKLALGELTDPAQSLPKRGTQPRLSYPAEKTTDEDWAREYLNALSPYRADDYDDWLKVGQCLHSVSDNLLDDWDRWSSQSSKYKPGVCDKKWKSFKPHKGLTIATLGAMAKEDGWQPKFKQSQSNRDSTDQAKETVSPRQEIESLIEQYTQTTDEIDKALIESKLFQGYKIGRNRLEAIIASQNKSDTTKPKARLLSPQEFFTAENTGIKWIVPGLVPVGGLTILAGSAGAGKTTLAYDCVASVIYGDSFLGEEVNKLGNVLIVSSDEPLPFAQDKMLNRGIQDKFTFLDQWDISQWGLLEQTIDEVNPDLIIIDSFSAIHMDDDFDENSPTAKNTIYRFNRLLEQYGCGGILTHHLAKNKENKGVNKLRGSTAIGAAATMVWMLEGEGEVKRFHQPKTRGTEPLDLKVKLDPNTGIFNVVEGQIYDDETKTLGDRILALFESLEPNTRLEMQELLGYISVSQDAMYKALRRLTKRGVLVTRPSTKNKRSKVWGLVSTDTPPPPTKADCPMTAETTTECESQTLDTYWTDSGQTLDTLDSNNCPESKTTTNTESQTLDRQLQLEGGVSQNNACPESKNEDENKKDISVSDGDIVTVKTLGGQTEAKVTEVRLGKKSKVIVYELDGQQHITYPKDSSLISIADQWGNIKWKK